MKRIRQEYTEKIERFSAAVLFFPRYYFSRIKKIALSAGILSNLCDTYKNYIWIWNISRGSVYRGG